ncbi:MAG TPA: SH3 domain-containing protein [Azospirillaceae bacterium]|nr:SH3 domain-containing protein [Azospirillaceae bacterium]
MRAGVALAGAALAVLGLSGAVQAAPGDIHRVTGERVNLRSAPSDEANIRSALERGAEVVEIRREGKWLGVRAVETGEEGWIYEDLVRVAAPSSLGGGGEFRQSDAGFRTWSQGFDSLMASVNERLGYKTFDRVEVLDGNTLRLTPSRQFLGSGNQEAHLLAALAVHQMFKNHQNGRPVSVAVLGPSGERYLTIDDNAATGPVLEVLELREARR